MPGEELPPTGAMRFTGTGDVEVFDGRSWLVLASVMGDSGMRQDSEPHGETGGGTSSWWPGRAQEDAAQEEAPDERDF